MQKLILSLILSIFLTFTFASNKKVDSKIDTTRLKILVDSLNKKVLNYGLSKAEMQAQKDGDVILKHAKSNWQFRFNFFKLGNDTTLFNENKDESKFGIKLRLGYPHSNAPRHTIDFITPDGETVAYLFFTCFKDLNMTSIHQLILAIRGECMEIKDYLK